MRNTNLPFAGKLTLAQKALIWAVKKPWGHRVHRLVRQKNENMGSAVSMMGINFYSVSYGDGKTRIWGRPVIRILVGRELYFMK